MTSPSIVTTPLHPKIHTPETPQFGFHDNYQPYSPSLSKHTSRRFHPHNETTDKKITPTSSNHSIRSSNRESKSIYSINGSNSTQSFQITRNKSKFGEQQADLHMKKTPNDSTSKMLEKEDKDISLSPLTSKTNRTSPASCCLSMGMLMTPTKTPMKRRRKNLTSVSSVARKLFSNELNSQETFCLSSTEKTCETTSREVSVTPDAEEEAEYISIFTDSRDRIPEVDLSPNNPFFLDKNSMYPSTCKSPSKPVNIAVKGEGFRTSHELVSREDGLLYNFRGKIIFRKFDNNTEFNEFSKDDLPGDDVIPLPRNIWQPTSRTSLKPRLLFPTIPKSTDRQTEEYILKDLGVGSTVEDSPLPKENPTKKDEKSLISLTPKFKPISPPNSFRASPIIPKIHEPNDRPIRTLRITKQELGDPITLGLRNTKKARPFASWQCTKPLSEKTRKRGGEPLDRDSPDKKIKL
ncbi:BgTH12-07245 [Blumeria graminis f. sp. triticale]|uniref:BgTH12-07245 n=1 Tax=Blumeria graminis f. sp. triticale TaxID=1689686 RepID=A0A9W4GI47_BLUGR|nr:BgTH12-07245 [Blumeria graminis f. sp. triticale]